MRNGEFYTVREGGEWAFIGIDEATGTFMSHGSFGTYGYTWSARGEGVTLKKFLRDLRLDYFMGKTRGAEWREFDPDETIKGLRTHIVEQRRWQAIDRKTARAAWDDLADIGYINTSQHFFDELYRSDAMHKVLGGDFSGVARTSPSPDCVGFWQKIWPAFLKQIVSAEKVAA